MSDAFTPDTTSSAEASEENLTRQRLWHEDWTIILLGAILLVIATLGVHVAPAAQDGEKPVASNSFKGWIAKFESWDKNPLDALHAAGKEGGKVLIHRPLGVTFALLAALVAGLLVLQNKWTPGSLLAILVLLVLASLAFVLAAQLVIKQFNFEYVLWALLVGLIISNTVGVPRFMESILTGESFIKLGIVLLGAEVLMSKLLALGMPGVCTSWIVTPIVLLTTFWFGQRVLRIQSPSLNMVIAADMSVCGVSAAIATGAACRAKKEEVSYAIGVSLLFTAIMMVVQPYVIRWAGIDPIVGAAWIGGTIDSTGAVVAAGAVLGKEAETVATTVKMIQNVLIGVVAFGVALYWTHRYPATKHHEGRRDGEASGSTAMQPRLSQIWTGFPKFILGFMAASIVFSTMPWFLANGQLVADTVIKENVAPLRTWLFCLGFVAIGLQTDFRKLWPYLSASRPLLLYVLGQAFNLLLSFIMAYLMFGIVFANQFAAGKP